MGSNENENTKCINPPSIPFLKGDDYKSLWDEPYNLFKEFCIPGKLYSLSQLELKNKEDKFDIYAQGDTDQLFKNKKVSETAALLILFRYRDTVEKISKEDSLSTKDFFNELEANREYHARAFMVLSSHGNTIKPEHVKVSNLDALEIDIYTINKKNNSPYSPTFILNELMILMAYWEIDWLSDDLFKKKYLDELFAQGNSLHSHLSLLSKFVNNSVEEFKLQYPYSVLINYSMFFPFDLHPSGEKPEGQSGSQEEVVPLETAAPPETTAPLETAAPPETTAPPETAAPKPVVPGFEAQPRSEQVKRIDELADAPIQSARNAADKLEDEAMAKRRRDWFAASNVRLAKEMHRLINSGNVQGARNLSRRRPRFEGPINTTKGTRKNNAPPLPLSPTPSNNSFETENTLPGSPTGSVNSAGTVNVMPTEQNYQKALMGARSGKNKGISQVPSPLVIDSRKGDHLSNK